MVEPDEVIEYWFGTEVDAAGVSTAKSKLWWGKSDETDREIRDRFGDVLRSASAGQREDWRETPRSSLALIIVLDQFSRVIHRDSAGMYANDGQAQALSIGMIGREADHELPLIYRVFTYMPLMHAEAIELQDRGVDEFAGLLDQADESERATFEHFHAFMVKHRDIVARFGRFPHRNALVGRDSSPDELAFLQQPGSSF